MDFGFGKDSVDGLYSYYVFTTFDGLNMPHFAYYVIALTISAAATYPENCGKTGQINAN